MPRAVRFHEREGPDSVVVDEVEKPTPGADQVVIEVAAAGVNRVDTVFTRGGFEGVYPHSRLMPPRLPHTPGSDCSGTVVAVGEAVRAFEEGDRVLAAGLGARFPGTYAEYVFAPTSQVAHLPEGISFQEGAGVGHSGVTAWNGLVIHGELKPTETCLIHGGSGGVGHIAVQLAAAMGADVVATAGSEERLERIRGLGATDAFDYNLDREDLKEKVLAATNGGPNVVLDYHLNHYLEFDLEVIPLNGRIVVVEGGDSSLDHQHLRLALWKDARIQATGMFNNPDISRTLSSLARLMVRGDLTIDVGRTYDLEEASQALKDVEQESYTGKLLIQP
jgi:NADPH:quinone reductase-like Zn-dependent oxidoreductase